MWLAPFRLGERESGTDNEEAVAAYREALKENTRERVCTPHIAAIAALAGCSRTSVKNPLRQPRLLSLVVLRNAASRPTEFHDIVSITSKEGIGWLSWG